MANNDYIEEKANNLVNNMLFDLFNENELKLVKHEAGRKEIGVDYFYDVFNGEGRDRQLILSFKTQNKGTNSQVKSIKSKNHPEYDKISYPLELSHVRQFYYDTKEPLLFVLCDINTEVAYWYSIQIDRTIPKRITEKEKELKARKSKTPPKLRIYIPKDNVINIENFKSIIDDIELSREEQNGKHSLKAISESDYSLIEEEIKDLHIIDKLYITLKKFESIKILPANIIGSLPVIKETKKRTWIQNFYLKSDNEELYDLFSKLKLSKGNIIHGDGELVENQADKLKRIANFFKSNYINHIQWGGSKYKEKLCIHKLFSYSNCDCARCSFDNLNFKRTECLLDNYTGQEPLFEQSRMGYAAYLIGDLKKCTTIYLNIYEQSLKINDFPSYIIAKYNLIKLERIIKWDYYDGNKHEFTEKVKDFNLDSDYGLIWKKAPHLVDVFKWINEDKFYHNLILRIDDLLNEAKKMYYYDKQGSTYSNEKSDELLAAFLRFYSFIEYNFIIYEYFYEFEKFTTKVLEAALALHSILNPKSSKYDTLDFAIIKIWLFHVKFDKAKELLHKYNLIRIKVADVVYEELNLYLDNLNASKEILNRDKKVYYFFDKVERVIKNITLLLSRVEMSNRKFNLILNKLLLSLNDVSLRKFKPYEGLKQILWCRSVNKKNMRLILNLFIEDDNIDSVVIKHYVEKVDKKEIKKFVFSLFEVKNFKAPLPLENKNFTKIGYAFSLLDNDLKKELETSLLTSLNQKFEPKLFHISTIYGLISFDQKLFNEFLKTIPDKSEQEEFFFGNSDNFRLSQVVNIMFKYDVPFTHEVTKYIDYCSEIEKPYFEWLMNMNNFDYSKFNPYWVLKHQTRFYLGAFRKSPQLLEAIKKSLKETYIEGVAQLYINQLC